jgi:hypothetical protein
MRTPALKNPMEFEGLGLCFWGGQPELKCPSRGDFYVSGAIPQGYRARQHLTREYWCVVPTHYAKAVTVHRRAEPIRSTPGGVPLPRRIAYPS